MIALPIVALFYLLATIGSALNYYLGKGMMWKGRAYVTPAIGGDKKELQIELENMVSSEHNNQTIEQKDNS